MNVVLYLFQRYAVSLLIVSIVMCLILGLYPFGPFQRPTDLILHTMIDNGLHKIYLFDVVQNLFFFLPVGFFAAAWIHAQSTTRGFWRAVAIALLLSLIIETVQAFIPMRVPSMLDLALNVLSGAAGYCAGRLLMCLLRQLSKQPRHR